MRLLILAVSAACLVPALALAETASDWKAKTVATSEQVDLLGGRDVPLSNSANSAWKPHGEICKSSQPSKSGRASGSL